MLEDSFLDTGFLFDKKPGVHQLKQVENAKVLIVNTPMDTKKIMVFGSNIKVDSMAKFSELEPAEKEKMKDKGHSNVFINHQLIYNYPEQMFAHTGVIVFH